MPLNSNDIKMITGCNRPDLTATWQEVISALQDAGINTPPVRVAMAATIAVESMFNPAARIDPEVLNTKYVGRGLIQITGLSNYVKYGIAENPDAAFDVATGARIAAQYFKDHGCNIAAARGNWLKVRTAVNGGTNGLDKFLSYIWLMLEAEYR